MHATKLENGTPVTVAAELETDTEQVSHLGESMTTVGFRRRPSALTDMQECAAQACVITETPHGRVRALGGAATAV